MGFFTDLKHAVRRLRRSPLFTAVALLTLAFGIGANAAIFSVVETILLKPLPFPQPDELVGVWHTAPGVDMEVLNSAPSLYFTYREEGRAFRDVALWGERSATVTGEGEPERVNILRVTDGILGILGVAPALGRGFTAEDDRAGSPPTVILSHRYWRDRFRGDPAVVGRRVVVDAEAVEVIGVMPHDFRFLDLKPAFLAPLRIDRSKVVLGFFNYQSVARLKPGVTLQAANADVARLLALALDRFPPPPGFDRKMFEDARIAPRLRPFKQDLVGDLGEVLFVLMGTIGMVLVIACANVANLLLVRAEGRQQELAVRAALGATGARLARELMLESLVLGLAGGALGLGVAAGFLRLLVFLAPAHLPRLDQIGIGVPVLLFTAGVSVLAGLVLSLIPIFRYAGPGIVARLRSASRSASENRERHHARNVLVVGQVALALVLLVASGLMIRSFRALRQVPPGFLRAEAVQTLRLTIPEAQINEDDLALVRMQQSILERIAALPGVEAAALASTVPLEGGGWNDPVYAEDETYAEGKIPPMRRFNFVSPGYLGVLGTPILAGRDLTWTDAYDGRPVVLVSENFARELWGSPSAALGRRIRETKESAWREIVGVAGDVHEEGLDRPAPAAVYWPLLMKGFETGGLARSLAVVVRSPRAGTEAFLKEIREAVWSVNASLPLAAVRTLQSLYDRSLARTSFTVVLLAIAGAMALLLGVVGLYGVVAYTVSQRSREIGIRMALGARRGALTFLFVRQGLLLAGGGAALGLLAALASSRLLSALLFGVGAADPTTYTLVAATLVFTAALASYLPARRVSAIDPAETLRAD